ncbi:hypothetical protein FI667_g8164, partial [Globisporangium splendens]
MVVRSTSGSEAGSDASTALSGKPRAKPLVPHYLGDSNNLTIQIEKDQQLDLDEAAQEILEAMQQQLNEIEIQQNSFPSAAEDRLDQLMQQVGEQATADKYIEADRSNEKARDQRASPLRPDNGLNNSNLDQLLFELQRKAEDVDELQSGFGGRRDEVQLLHDGQESTTCFPQPAQGSEQQREASGARRAGSVRLVAGQSRAAGGAGHVHERDARVLHQAHQDPSEIEKVQWFPDMGRRVEMDVLMFGAERVLIGCNRGMNVSLLVEIRAQPPPSGWHLSGWCGVSLYCRMPSFFGEHDATHDRVAIATSIAVAWHVANGSHNATAAPHHSQPRSSRVYAMPTLAPRPREIPRGESDRESPRPERGSAASGDAALAVWRTRAIAEKYRHRLARAADKDDAVSHTLDNVTVVNTLLGERVVFEVKTLLRFSPDGRIRFCDTELSCVTSFQNADVSLEHTVLLTRDSRIANHSLVRQESTVPAPQGGSATTTTTTPKSPQPQLEPAEQHNI